MQDEERFKSSSQAGGLEVEFGFGNNWSLSGYGNASSGKTQRKQVNEQAGLFAEEGGYHINADQVHLKAGAIASTNPQNSELRTNSLTFEDIQNSSASRAMSGGVSGGIAERKGESQRQETPSQAGTNPNITNAKQQGNGNSFNPSLPMAYRSQDESVTKATLTEGTIILNKDSQPTQTTAAALGINTELAQANRQTAATADVKAQVAEQQQIAAAVNQVRSAAETFSSNKREEAELVLQQRQAELAIAQAQGDKAKEAQLQDQVDTAQEAVNDWSTGGKNRQAVDATLNGLGLALGGNSIEAVAAGAASPYVNTAIKHATESEGYEWANLALHGIWGAVEATTQGANALGGASSAVTGEVAAKILTEKLFGETNPEALTEEQKRAVSHLSQMIAGAVSGGTELAQGGDTISSVQNVNVGMGIAKNAVENNYLYADEAARKAELMMLIQTEINPEKKAQYQEELDGIIAKDIRTQKEIEDNCPRFGKGSSACQASILDAEKARLSYSHYSDEFQPVGYSREKRQYKNVFTYDYGRTNEALAGKDPLTLQKEVLALDLAKSGDMTKEDAYRVLDNSMTLSDTLMALGGIKTVSNEKFLAFLTGKYKLPVIGKTQGYEYSNVRVSSGAENVALYQKLKEDLFKQQQKGFENVIKDLSKKPKGSVLMLPDYRKQLADARNSLSNNPKLRDKGNVAVARIDIEGVDTKTLASHSRINVAQGDFVGKGKTQFSSLSLPNKDGVLINRNTDSEYKIFSNLADQLGGNTQAKGNLTIFTERPACKSCLGVAEQFNKRYPNIKVNIFDNNGNTIKPLGKK